MKSLRTLFAACLLAAASLMASAIAAEETSPASKATFLVIYRPGPAWLQGKPVSEQPLLEHGRYLLSLFAKGTMKSAGPFLDDAGGAVILEVADEAEAKALVAQDPAVIERIMVAEIHPWKLQPWDQYLEKAREREAATKSTSRE